MKNAPLKVIIAGVIALALVALGAFFALRYYKQRLNSPQDLLARVGARYDIPPNETPTIATVSDKTKLQNQAFFAKAENGDKVLVFSIAKKGILYRPSIDKIIEVAPLSFEQNVPSVAPNTPTAQPEKKVEISIYNGTKIRGLASATEKKITEQLKNIEVVEKENAVKDYTGILVIDMSATNADRAKSIAEIVGGTIASFPPGEKTPKGEILVIMGK